MAHMMFHLWQVSAPLTSIRRSGRSTMPGRGPLNESFSSTWVLLREAKNPCSNMERNMKSKLCIEV